MSPRQDASTMTDARTPLRVLVLDDHAIIRLGVRHLFGDRAQVFEAESVAAARSWLAGQRCDLLLLDLGLGDDFGLSALPGLRQADPTMKIIVLTSMAEDLYAERALRAGVDGFIMKSALGDTLMAAVDTVMAGHVYTSSQVSSQLLRRATGRDTTSTRPELSPREVEVLRLIAAGLSTREIADKLNRSVKTVETHKQALKTKLEADSPARLMRLAVSWFADSA